MFDRKELGGIILLADIAMRMERILHVLGINQGIEERILILELRKKAQELHNLTQPSTEEKVEEVLAP